jgi:hypothetical protein
MHSRLLQEQNLTVVAVLSEVYTISKLIKCFVIPLLAWEAAVAGSIAIMYTLARRNSIGPEGRAFLIWAFVLGFLVVLPCWPVCRRLRQLPGTLTGLCIGFITPVVAGWLWAQVVEPTRVREWPHAWSLPWGLNWGGPDAWFAGLVLSIPSGIAGGIVGFLQARSLAPAKEIDLAKDLGN